LGKLAWIERFRVDPANGDYPRHAWNSAEEAANEGTLPTSIRTDERRNPSRCRDKGYPGNRITLGARIAKRDIRERKS
jgi:hypothetical protein